MIPLNNPKLLTLETALAQREALRQAGRKLVVTNGCFDLLHAGHAYYLQEAARQGDALWLLLNSDASIAALKGPTRPVQELPYRAYVLASLSCVAALIPFETLRATRELRALEPDIYVKAGDYTLETLDAEERAALQAVKAEIRFMPFLKGFSSTRLMERIRLAGSL